MDSLKHPRRPWGTNGVTERATPSVMAIGGAASRRSPCSVLRLTGRMPTPAHSSCTASDAIFPCPTTPAERGLGSSGCGAPSPDEADGPASIAVPLWLSPDPSIIDDGLVHLRCDQAGSAGRSDMGTGEVYVRLDRDGLTVGTVEMGRHPRRHDEVRVVADDDKGSTRREQSARLRVELVQLRQV